MLCALLASLAAWPLYAQPGPSNTLHGFQNTVIEWSYTSHVAYDNPFFDLTLDVLIVAPDGSETRIPAFWGGGGQWRVRYSASEPGTYRFRTVASNSSDKDLHDRRGILIVEPYEGENPLFKHGPVRVHEGGRYLEHRDGKPFFWLADSWWTGMTMRLSWPDGFQLLTADRAQKGFSVIQFASGFPCDMPAFDQRGANEAGHPWTQGFGTINPAYFDLVDLRIGWLVQMGLVPNVVGSWGYYLPMMGVEKMERHWRYLIARYGAYPVVWTLGGEVTLPWYLAEDLAAAREEQREGWAEVAKYIKQIDPYKHLLTVHPGPGSGDLEPLSDMNPVDLVMLQTGHQDFDVARQTLEDLIEVRLRYPDRPMLIGEACFEGMHGGGCGAKIQRFLFWTAMLSEAAGHSYGADAIWQMNTREAPFGPSPLGQVWGNAPWEEAYRWPGAAAVAAGKRILERFPWWQMETQPDCVKPAADLENVYAPYCAGIPGKLVMLYLPKGVPPWGNSPVVQKLPPEKLFRASYIDPITGAIHVIGEVQATKEGTWEAPFSPVLQDWVLALEAVNP